MANLTPVFDFTHKTRLIHIQIPLTGYRFHNNAIPLWLLSGISMMYAEGTLLLLHHAITPVGVAAEYPHSYCNL